MTWHMSLRQESHAVSFDSFLAPSFKTRPHMGPLHLQPHPEQTVSPGLRKPVFSTDGINEFVGKRNDVQMQNKMVEILSLILRFCVLQY